MEETDNFWCYFESWKVFILVAGWVINQETFDFLDLREFKDTNQ